MLDNFNIAVDWFYTREMIAKLFKMSTWTSQIAVQKLSAELYA